MFTAAISPDFVAGTTFTIAFDNKDATIHNVDIYTSQGGSHLAGANGASDVVSGPASTTYNVPALQAGTYYFQCDIHPTQMFGTFVVAGT